MNVVVSRFARPCLSIVAGLVLALAADMAPVHGAASITPVVMDIGPAGRGALKITNKRDQPVTYQLTPLTWDVVDNNDVYEPTNDFIASPPSFTLKPNQTREVRVGFRNPARSPVERAYRLVVEEVPFEASAEEAGSEQGIQINFRMRYLLPVYVAPAAAPAADLIWSVRRQGGSAIVRAENRGNRRFVVRELGFNAGTASAGEPTYALAEPQAVLAQSWREWTIAVPAGVRLETLLVRSSSNDDFDSVPFSR